MSHHGIFITGCPRSGTTLLQSILASHSQLYTAPETSFFSRIIPRLGINFSRPDAIVGDCEVDITRKDFEMMTGVDLPVEFSNEASGRTMREVFERLLACFNDAGKPMWVEKTTLHARHLPLIATYYPEMKVVNVIRDPVACVGSMARIRPTGLRDFRIRYLASLADFSRIWNDCVSMAMDYPDRDRIMHVRYEHLVESPTDTVQEICSFLGIRYEPGMLESFHESAQEIFSGEACPWQRQNLNKGISRDSLYAWRERLGAAKTWLIQRYTLRRAMELGYFAEDLGSNRLTLVLAWLQDQLLRLVAASRVELIFRKLLTGAGL